MFEQANTESEWSKKAYRSHSIESSFKCVKAFVKAIKSEVDILV